MLIQKIKQDLVSHIKSGDKIKISITRLLNNKVYNAIVKLEFYIFLFK